MINKSKNKIKYTSSTIKLGIFIILISMIAINAFHKLSESIIIYTKNVSVKEVMSLSVVVNQEDYLLQKNNEKYRNSNIEVYYPITKYEVLNNEIKTILDTKIFKFKENIKDNIEYSMLINFDMYKYNNYISFVFHVLEDYAGAHPNTYIFTVNYNIKDNTIININTLVNKNNNILNLMSKYAYKNLLNNDKIKVINLLYMLKNGTKPIKTNFENFAFEKNGIIVFFEKYQVAPFAYGEFCITIPYLELNFKIDD